MILQAAALTALLVVTSLLLGVAIGRWTRRK